MPLDESRMSLILAWQILQAQSLGGASPPQVWYNVTLLDANGQQLQSVGVSRVFFHQFTGLIKCACSAFIVLFDSGSGNSYFFNVTVSAPTHFASIASSPQAPTTFTKPVYTSIAASAGPFRPCALAFLRGARE